MIKLGPFGGMIPRTGNRLIPDTSAQSASNVKVHSGELHPLHGLGDAYAVSKPMPPLSIFKARNGTDSSAWFSWPIDVDCVRVPLAVDVESLFCWTGDGPPKMARYTSAVSGGGENYPLADNELSLGIPAPQTAPTVTPSATGIGSTVTRGYRYTFVSAANPYEQESAPSPITMADGKTDDTWALALLDEVPANSGVGTAAYGTDTTFTNAASARHWLRVGDEVILSDVSPAVLVTATVTAIPTPHSFKVSGDYSAAVSWERKTPWNTAGMVKRVYRTTGTTGSWQLVNETGLSAATTTYDDTLSDADIAGDDLITEGWIPPPVGLKALCVHPSGSLLGIAGNLLCASEPHQPHAWPVIYQLASNYNGVGLACFGSSVVMATDGEPFVATGTEPASMSGDNIQGTFPCLSKRSVVSTGDSVLYASKHGQIQVGAGGLRIFTDQFYTREKWEELNPETMVCEIAGGRLYISYTNQSGTRQMLMIEGPVLIPVSIAAEEIYADPSTGELYIGTAEGIQLFDAPDVVVLPGAWRSKDFVMPYPVNMGAAKIDFDLAVDVAQQAAVLAAIAAAEADNAAIMATGNAHGSINSSQINSRFLHGADFVDVPAAPAANTVTLNLYAGGVLKASRVVSSKKAFRLPAKYKADVYSIEVITQCVVKEIRIAETMEQLRQG